MKERSENRKAGKGTLGSRDRVNKVLRQKTGRVQVQHGGFKEVPGNVTSGGASGPPSAAARAQLGPCVLSLQRELGCRWQPGLHCLRGGHGISGGEDPTMERLEKGQRALS